MDNIALLLQTLFMVLAAAALMAFLFRKLKLPVVLGYMLAGLIIGPHTPGHFISNFPLIHTLAEFGVVFLMFSLGLGFSIRKLFKVIPRTGVIALFETGLLMWCGYLVAKMLGWSYWECFYAGAMVAISSTTIIMKVFADEKDKGKLSHIIFSILIVEDLIAILVLAILTTLSSSSTPFAAVLAQTTGFLLIFLAAILFLGMLIIPRVVRILLRLHQPEITILACVALCFSCALLAQAFGYPIALGAFIAGALVAESGYEQILSQQIQPLRDLFGAIFFVAVGMLIDPAVILQHWESVLLFSAVVVFGKMIAVSVGAFLLGNTMKLALQAGMSLAQIGEFSFIIAGAGVASGVIGESLYSLAIAVSGVTTLLTPLLIRSSNGVVRLVDRALPAPLQTFAILYGSWIQRLRAASQSTVTRSHVRRLLKLIVLDTLLLAVTLFLPMFLQEQISAKILSFMVAPLWLVQMGILGGVTVIALPLCIGLVRTAKRLGLELALLAMPVAETGKLDLGAAPRRVLVVTYQLMILLVVGLLLLLVSQAFFPLQYGLIILGVCLFFLGIAFWRSAASLQGHMKAGVQIIVEALSLQEPQNRNTELKMIENLLPGFGNVASLSLPERSKAVGKTLVELNLRAITGVSVVAIMRCEGEIVTPNGNEHLQALDQLVCIGSDPALEATKKLLGE